MREENQELIPDNQEKQMEKLYFNCPLLCEETTGMGWQKDKLISFP